jgi:hypothetical protein
MIAAAIGRNKGIKSSWRGALRPSSSETLLAGERFVDGKLHREHQPTNTEGAAS